MTTRYVAKSLGNDAWDGLSPVWTAGLNGPKASLVAMEATPVTPGDLIHVKGGFADVYREMLTCGVSGTAGNAIEYRGDYKGLIWPGGGVVRITGSDDDRTATRANCIAIGARNYRTFTGFQKDGHTTRCVTGTGTDVTIQSCALESILVGGASGEIEITGAGQARWTIQNCYLVGGATGLVRMTHSTEVTAAAHLIQNCILWGGRTGIYSAYVGGYTIKNCLVARCTTAGIYVTSIASSTVTVNNCNILWNVTGLGAGDVADITANYNNVAGNLTARSNVNTGANDTAYLPLLDTRWFFEMVNAGRLVTPFDLSQWSQLINVAGTSPPATDMRGTAAIGGVREWGPLEYDTTLLIESAAGGGMLKGERRGGKQ